MQSDNSFLKITIYVRENYSFDLGSQGCAAQKPIKQFKRNFF